jgi:hypothetical protein
MPGHDPSYLPVRSKHLAEQPVVVITTASGCGRIARTQCTAAASAATGSPSAQVAPMCGSLSCTIRNGDPMA